MPPELEGRYELLGELGRGSFGTVYRIRERSSGAEFALKLVRELGDTRRLERELAIARELDHSAVLRCFDAGFSGETAWMVLELADGSLEDLLASSLDRDRAWAVLRRAAEGVAAMHRAGLIHRDLKPENILLVKGRAKVADLGLARGGGHETVTGTGVILGSPAYMSPEQARGEKVTPASDLYTLGVIAYQIVEGHLPYPDSELSELMTRVAQGRTDPLVRCRGWLAPDTRRSILQALDPDPARRPTDAAIWAAELGVLEVDPGPETDKMKATRVSYGSDDGLTRESLPRQGQGQRRQPQTKPEPRVVAVAAEPAPPGRRVGAAALAGLAFAGIALGAWLTRGEPSAPPAPTASPLEVAASQVADLHAEIARTLPRPERRRPDLLLHPLRGYPAGVAPVPSPREKERWQDYLQALRRWAGTLEETRRAGEALSPEDGARLLEWAVGLPEEWIGRSGRTEEGRAELAAVSEALSKSADRAEPRLLLAAIRLNLLTEYPMPSGALRALVAHHRKVGDEREKLLVQDTIRGVLVAFLRASSKPCDGAGLGEVMGSLLHAVKTGDTAFGVIWAGRLSRDLLDVATGCTDERGGLPGGLRDPLHELLPVLEALLEKLRPGEASAGDSGTIRVARSWAKRELDHPLPRSPGELGELIARRTRALGRSLSAHAPEAGPTPDNRGGIVGAPEVGYEHRIAQLVEELQATPNQSDALEAVLEKCFDHFTRDLRPEGKWVIDPDMEFSSYVDYLRSQPWTAIIGHATPLSAVALKGGSKAFFQKALAWIHLLRDRGVLVPPGQYPEHPRLELWLREFPAVAMRMMALLATSQRTSTSTYHVDKMSVGLVAFRKSVRAFVQGLLKIDSSPEEAPLHPHLIRICTDLASRLGDPRLALEALELRPRGAMQTTGARRVAYVVGRARLLRLASEGRDQFAYQCPEMWKEYEFLIRRLAEVPKQWTPGGWLAAHRLLESWLHFRRNCRAVPSAGRDPILPQLVRAAGWVLEQERRGLFGEEQAFAVTQQGLLKANLHLRILGHGLLRKNLSSLEEPLEAEVKALLSAIEVETKTQAELLGSGPSLLRDATLAAGHFEEAEALMRALASR